MNYINYLKIIKMKALRVLKYIGFGILGVGFVIGVIFGVQALWNCLIPELFHGPLLSFWQTAGLFLLSKILLTGVAPGGRSHHHGNREWKRKYNDKFSHGCRGEENVADPATT
jgi:hypothetical protein